MAKKKSVSAVKNVSETVRLCANIRSRKHPDVRCPCSATHGEFCTRHFKNPIRFQEKMTLEDLGIHTILPAILKIQKWWRLYIGFLRFKKQGPAANIPDIAENKTDIYTLDTTTSIPLIYRWSYSDAKKHIWLFDVRSLSMTHTQDSREKIMNPYTREPLTGVYETCFQNRCSWLRSKKYCLLHSENIDLTPEQLWHQKILDVTMKYDMLGYHTCLHWFENLTVRQLIDFYTEIWELWFYRLQLSPVIKRQVVPNWNNQDTLLFKWSPREIHQRTDKRWLHKLVLDTLDKLVSSASLKEHRILGALYGMTAFAIVSDTVREHYPWLVEMNDDV